MKSNLQTGKHLGVFGCGYGKGRERYDKLLTMLKEGGLRRCESAKDKFENLNIDTVQNRLVHGAVRCADSGVAY